MEFELGFVPGLIMWIDEAQQQPYKVDGLGWIPQWAQSGDASESSFQVSGARTNGSDGNVN